MVLTILPVSRIRNSNRIEPTAFPSSRLDLETRGFDHSCVTTLNWYAANAALVLPRDVFSRRCMTLSTHSGEGSSGHKLSRHHLETRQMLFLGSPDTSFAACKFLRSNPPSSRVHRRVTRNTFDRPSHVKSPPPIAGTSRTSIWIVVRFEVPRLHSSQRNWRFDFGPQKT